MNEFEQSDRLGWSAIHAVVRVATHRSFRRAASELGMSPSALSHAVATLETKLGVRLFHRTTRSVALSEAGLRFVTSVRPAIAAIAEAVEGVNKFRDTPAGTLRINASEAAARRVLAPLVVPFLARYPDMRVDIAADARFVDIVAAGFDAGVRAADVVPSEMIAVPCSDASRFVVVGAPSYFAKRPKPKTPADILRHDCLRMRMPNGANMRWEFARRGHETTFDPAGRLTLDHPGLVIDAAIAGAGLAFASIWAVEEHVKAKRLVTVLDAWTPEYPGLCLYYPRGGRSSAGLRAFVQMVKEARRSGRSRRTT